MRSDKTNLIPEDFDLRFQRAFGLLAFSVNRHIVDHMRRLCIELSLDPETAQILTRQSNRFITQHIGFSGAENRT